MFSKILAFFKPEPKPHWADAITDPVPDEPKAKRKPPVKKSVDPRSVEKEKATEAGEPYVAILSVDIDPDNINNGSFELDFNDKFVINLIKAGYKHKETDKDSDIVDRWFAQVCRNVVMEVYEQAAADPENRDPDLDTRIINRRPLGAGRAELS